MTQAAYSRIVLERADGRVEVVSRPGFVDPQAAALAFAASGCKITAVRHEHLSEGQRKPTTLAIHRVK